MSVHRSFEQSYLRAVPFPSNEYKQPAHENCNRCLATEARQYRTDYWFVVVYRPTYAGFDWAINKLRSLAMDQSTESDGRGQPVTSPLCYFQYISQWYMPMYAGIDRTCRGYKLDCCNGENQRVLTEGVITDVVLLRTHPWVQVARKHQERPVWQAYSIHTLTESRYSHVESYVAHVEQCFLFHQMQIDQDNLDTYKWCYQNYNKPIQRLSSRMSPYFMQLSLRNAIISHRHSFLLANIAVISQTNSTPNSATQAAEDIDYFNDFWH